MISAKISKKVFADVTSKISRYNVPPNVLFSALHSMYKNEVLRQLIIRKCVNIFIRLCVRLIRIRSAKKYTVVKPNLNSSVNIQEQ